MNIQSKKISYPTGYFKGDIYRFFKWAQDFQNELNHLLNNISSDDIKSLSADKIDFNSGGIATSNIKITSDSISVINNGVIIFSVTPDSFLFQSPDGSNYIKLEDNCISAKLSSIECSDISCTSLTAHEVTTEVLNGSNV